MTEIPSPDAALIGLAERIAAIPQRRGIPLPYVLLPLPFVETIGILLVASIVLSLPNAQSAGVVGGMFLMIAFVDLVVNVRAAHRRRRDGRDWGPKLAIRYRAEALQARETYVVHRYVYALMTAISLCMCATAISTGYPLLMAMAFAFLMWPMGKFAQQYFECVMPVDPDLRSPQAVPQGA